MTKIRMAKADNNVRRVYKPDSPIYIPIAANGLILVGFLIYGLVTWKEN
jgi:hypothetical protein